MSQNNINHIAFVVDASTSMSDKSKTVVELFDAQIKHLARRSKEVNQETRVSVYFFSHSDSIHCVIFDKDVLRLPSLAGLYTPNGNTALRDATLKAVVDLETTSQIYGDHAFLLYAITDGEENDSAANANSLARRLNGLPDNWTVAVLVPDASGVHEAKRAGFPADNIAVWDTSDRNMVEMEKKMTESTETFFQNRAKGIRGTRSLFKIDTSNLSSKKVNDSLDSLKSHEFIAVALTKDGTIRDVVERATGEDYVKGSAFYQLSKPETVQSYKKVCIRNKISGYVYSGDKARKLLNLPDTDARIKPEGLAKFDIFVQSTSVNRKLIGGTTLIILKNP
jgi:hypothetical protein